MAGGRPTRPPGLPGPGAVGRHDGPVSAEDLESYENELELSLYREYRDVASLFSYVVETERRFYLANAVDVQVRTSGGEVFFELTLEDAWVWDIYRASRFVKSVHVVTFKDVNVEELTKLEMDIPSSQHHTPALVDPCPLSSRAPPGPQDGFCQRPPQT